MNPQLIVILGLVLLAVVLIGAVIGPALRRGFQQDRVRTSGRDATATIRAIERTGMGVDEQVEIKLTLDVEPTDRPAYTGELVVTVLVSDLMLTYPVGGRVRVRFDPEDPSKLALVGPPAP